MNIEALVSINPMSQTDALDHDHQMTKIGAVAQYY